MDDNVYARLVSVKENGSDGSSLPLFRGKLYHIGRDKKCEIKIADPSVLYWHCCIDYVELEGARITPAAGTRIRINSEETSDPVMLQNGDMIRLGNKMLRIDVRRILPTRENDDAPLPEPLLVDMVTPPRVTKMTVRAKTQCKSLLSSTKPPVVPVSKKADDSPVKRQLFSDDENENLKPAHVRNTRKKKTVTAAKNEQVVSKKSRGKAAEKKEKTSASKSVIADTADPAVMTRRSSRRPASSATSASNVLAGPTRKCVRFAAKTKS